jgi:hypothetical protein
MWEQLKGQRKGSNRSMIKFKNHGLIAVGKRVVGAAWSTIQQIVHSIAGTLFNNPVSTKRVMEAKLPPNICPTRIHVQGGTAEER